MRLKFLPAIIAILATNVLAATDETTPRRLSAEDCIILATKTSEVIGSARAELQYAQGALRVAGAALLPQISSSITYARISSADAFLPGASEMFPGLDSQFGADLTLSQVIYAGGQIKAAQKVAGIANELAETQYQLTTLGVDYGIHMAYAAALLQRELVNVAKESVELSEGFLKNAKSQERVGQTTEFDTLRASVRLRNAEAELIKANTGAHVALANLVRMTGLESAHSVELTDTLDALIVSTLNKLGGETGIMELRSKAGSSLSPELKARDLAQKIQSIVRDVSTASLRPQVAFFGNYNGAGFTGFFDDNFDFSWTCGLSVSVSVFDGGAARGKKLQETARLAQAELAREGAKKDIELAQKTALWRLGAAQKFIISAEASMQEATRAVKLASTQMRVGNITQLQLDEVRIGMAMAHTNHAQAKFELLSALLDLKKSLGL